jgi:hypothetical protein
MMANTIGQQCEVLKKQQLNLLSYGHCDVDEVKNDANCMCYSTCALIWLSVIHRLWVGTIGIHRPFYPKAQFGQLTTGGAEASYANLTVWLDPYLGCGLISA